MCWWAVIPHYGFARWHRSGNLGKGDARLLCVISYNHMWTYDYLRSKDEWNKPSLHGSSPGGDTKVGASPRGEMRMGNGGREGVRFDPFKLLSFPCITLFTIKYFKTKARRKEEMSLKGNQLSKYQNYLPGSIWIRSINIDKVPVYLVRGLRFKFKNY